VKVSTEKIPHSQVVLEIEVEPERVERSMEAAYRRLVQRANVPGFRRGKAPRAMLERHLGRDTLFEEALDRLIPEVYREAIDMEDIDPIESPEVEMVSTEPLVMKATVPVRPTVELGDYHQMWIPREPVVVPEERVDEAIDQLRHRYASLEPVERPIQWRDVVTADVSGTVDDKSLFERKEAQFQLLEERPVFLPGLAEQIIGLEKDAEKEVEVPLPEDFPGEEMAGKSCKCHVKVSAIREEILPELDDAFARQVGESFDSVDALRERLRADIQEAEERTARESYEEQIIDTMAETATLEFPPVLVEKEIDHILRDQMGPGGDQQAFERYLERIGRTQEQLREELRPTAEQRVRRSLLLSKVSEVENILVDDAEVTQELDRMATSAGPQAQEIKRVFDNPGGREALSRSLLTRKTWDKLIEIVSTEKAGEKVEEAPIEEVVTE